jgi:hypothetical protein
MTTTYPNASVDRAHASFSEAALHVEDALDHAKAKYPDDEALKKYLAEARRWLSQGDELLHYHIDISDRSKDLAQTVLGISGAVFSGLAMGHAMTLPREPLQVRIASLFRSLSPDTKATLMGWLEQAALLTQAWVKSQQTCPPPPAPADAPAADAAPAAETK